MRMAHCSLSHSVCLQGVMACPMLMFCHSARRSAPAVCVGIRKSTQSARRPCSLRAWGKGQASEV